MKSFDKDPQFIIYEEEPFNGGPPMESLPRSFVTPKERFFVRNHGAVPQIDPARYRLSVDGMVKRPLNLSLEEIQNDFPKETVMATLQCAGNRRRELMAIAPISDEVPWGAEAISNAVWSGAPLREVLRAAGADTKAGHVALTGLDEVKKGSQRFGFGGSIPLSKAMSSEVLLAYEMNDELLTPVHGFPLRVVVPGYIGARSIKWLSRIIIQADPSSNHFQAHAYKLFPSDVRAETADWTSGQMLGELPINAVICRPKEGDLLPADLTLIQGYAITAGSQIERVELSIDGGKTWESADLSNDTELWSWRFWQVRQTLERGPCEIIARAWDSSGKTQPEDVSQTWNFKGYVNNAWHRINVRVTG